MQKHVKINFSKIIIIFSKVKQSENSLSQMFRKYFFRNLWPKNSNLFAKDIISFPKKGVFGVK